MRLLKLLLHSFVGVQIVYWIWPAVWELEGGPCDLWMAVPSFWSPSRTSKMLGFLISFIPVLQWNGFWNAFLWNVRLSPPGFLCRYLTFKKRFSHQATLIKALHTVSLCFVPLAPLASALLPCSASTQESSLVEITCYFVPWMHDLNSILLAATVTGYSLTPLLKLPLYF